MSDVEENEVIRDLLHQITMLEADMTLARMELTPINDQIEETDGVIKGIRNTAAEEIHALYEQIRAVERKRDEDIQHQTEQLSKLKESKFDLSRKLRQDESNLASLQRQLDQARRAALKSAEWATLADRWDKLTMGAPWREWAKDHQISGAKKWVYEADMILADTMGLGKTLTSLIGIDMIEAATRDASPDNPITFGGMK